MARTALVLGSLLFVPLPVIPRLLNIGSLCIVIHVFPHLAQRLAGKCRGECIRVGGLELIGDTGILLRAEVQESGDWVLRRAWVLLFPLFPLLSLLRTLLLNSLSWICIRLFLFRHLHRALLFYHWLRLVRRALVRTSLRPGRGIKFRLACSPPEVLVRGPIAISGRFRGSEYGVSELHAIRHIGWCLEHGCDPFGPIGGGAVRRRGNDFFRGVRALVQLKHSRECRRSGIHRLPGAPVTDPDRVHPGALLAYPGR
mmetsp:Transcript_8342/g.22578  ORF Transcript_8342/g.22578 Transcript_8342/m.22578 type:complete len:256 (+) Transcript_8342:544-1311(+)